MVCVGCLALSRRFIHTYAQHTLICAHTPVRTHTLTRSHVHTHYLYCPEQSPEADTVTFILQTRPRASAGASSDPSGPGASLRLGLHLTLWSASPSSRPGLPDRRQPWPLARSCLVVNNPSCPRCKSELPPLFLSPGPLLMLVDAAQRGPDGPLLLRRAQWLPQVLFPMARS